MGKMDKRITTIDYEVRQLEDSQKTVIRGYALKFDTPSEDLGFIEYLDKRCLDNADLSQVVALVNHDQNQVLGRSGRNLTLKVDDIGLYFEVEPPDTSYARDLVENMRQGLIDKCSFAFTTEKEGGARWEKESDGKLKRTILAIRKVFDVSVVTIPAYSDTVALLSSRSLDELSIQNQTYDREREIMQLQLSL